MEMIIICNWYMKMCPNKQNLTYHSVHRGPNLFPATFLKN